jgi:hypothetical protein
MKISLSDKHYRPIQPYHDELPKLVVVSLGAGVQSSTMALMAAEGHIKPMPDCAIFADTGYEPPAVYEYLEWLTKKLPFPVYTVSKGNLRDDMISSVDHGTRFPTAPFYTINATTGKKGMLMRQCTNDYKIQPIRKKIRELLGIGYYKHVKKNVWVDQWIGISTDEIARMKPARDKYIINRWPLLELGINRRQCLDWFKKKAFPQPSKSACICCPFHDDAYWQDMKTNRPEEFADAVDFDEKIRHGSRKKEDELFLHRSAVPLKDAKLNPKKEQIDMFDNVCEGMCGV